jgi:hypothetical protein
MDIFEVTMNWARDVGVREAAIFKKYRVAKVFWDTPYK